MVFLIIFAAVALRVAYNNLGCTKLLMADLAPFIKVHAMGWSVYYMEKTYCIGIFERIRHLKNSLLLTLPLKMTLALCMSKSKMQILYL